MTSLHDAILCYSKTNSFVWNKTFESYDEKYIEDFYRFSDGKGRYRLVTLTGAGTRTGDSGKPWREVNPTISGQHWAVPNGLLEEVAPGILNQELTTQEKLDVLDQAELVYWPTKGSVPQYKRYLREDGGNPIQDVITDILPISSQAAERLPYPTQKPQALLERIIQASSNEGDVVLDPFCGCGTAVHAAQKLNRRWIGIDITHLAVSLIEKRLKSAFPYLKPVTAGKLKAAESNPNQFEVIGVPHDLDAARDLALRDKHQFQLWACTLVGAQPYKGGRRSSDKGIDGLIFPEVGKNKAERIVVSVKGGEAINVSMVRDLKGVVEREKAIIGLFVTLTPPTREMKKEATASGHYESPHHGAFPKIQILTIEGLLDGTEQAKFPDMTYGAQTFKKAKKEERIEVQPPLL